MFQNLFQMIWNDMKGMGLWCGMTKDLLKYYQAVNDKSILQYPKTKLRQIKTKLRHY